MVIASSGMAATPQWFHSDMHLMPDQNLGFFVSYNSAGKGEGSPRTILWQNFLNRYFPYTPPEAQPVADSAADAKAIAGTVLVEPPFGDHDCFGHLPVGRGQGTT